jgi:peptidylprolyl isomerase
VLLSRAGAVIVRERARSIRLSAAMPPRSLRQVTLLALAAALLTAGCGDDADSNSAGAEQPTETTAAEARESLEDTSSKPVIEKPSGSPPRKLVKEDIVKGKGRGAESGDRITVHYVGVSFSTGDEFDASWDTGRPFTFTLGAGEVIPGWDRGIVGMRKGGRRTLTIPPELAYGAEGSGPIAPNETLVFVVDLVKGPNPRS